MPEQKFSNHLIHETSPYLLQHAHNPVDWFAWNEETLRKAKQEDKPILLSIGYSACHWCHVMAHESFDDEATAQLMNELFINIKMDREEHPEIDHIYMDAIQLMTGSGGWPLNIFLTPELKPFYGGTYFPPSRAYNRPTWKEILTAVAESFQERREEVEEYADKMVEYLNSGSKILPGNAKPAITQGEELMRTAFEQLSEQFDTENGGFGGAPKFPATFCIRFLLQYDHFYQSRPALDHALLSVDKIIEGGIYDQLGGGMARYSTDVKWLVPHFEKMLYDNALLLEVLAEAFQLTKNKKYEHKMRETIDFVFRELSDDGKSFYAALDADSEGEEGKFYVWSLNEVQHILGDEAKIFCDRYDVTEEGNWEGKNILHESVGIEDLQLRFQLAKEKIEQSLSEGKQKMFDARAKRIRPSLDDKKILSWNALMIAALSKCAQALADEALMKKTVSSMQHLLDSFSIKKETVELYHHSAKGKFFGKALFDDYAYFIRACLLVYEITFEEKWLHIAKKLTDFVMENFSDEKDPLFFMTATNEANIIARPKDYYDGALPSGNAVMSENLMKLGIVYGDKDFTAKSEKMIQSVEVHALKFPTSFSFWLMNLCSMINGSEELVLIGRDFCDAVMEIGKNYIPDKIVMASENENSNFPLLENKGTMNGKLTFYRCRNYACLQPTNNLTEFLKPFRAK